MVTPANYAYFIAQHAIQTFAIIHGVSVDVLLLLIIQNIILYFDLDSYQ